jgi:ketosteroid isomerase-like protein
MSQKNVEIVRRGFAAFDSSDLDRLRDLVTDDLIVYRTEPNGAESHGDGSLQLTADWTEGGSCVGEFVRDWAPIRRR